MLARLAHEQADGARFADFGIGVVHLAYELLDGYDAAVIVDAVSRGGRPGTLYVIEPDAPVQAVQPDAHRMDLSSVFAFVARLGGKPPPITVIGCEPESLEEGAELSTPVAQAVEAALPLVRRIVDELLAKPEEPICTEA